jgi:DNA polymerase-1
MTSFNNSIFLIDSKYLCYRSVYALKKTPIDQINSAMYFGFMKTVIGLAKGAKVHKTKEVLHPKEMILCWDSKHSYRKMSYPPYKDKDRSKLTPEEEKTLEKINRGTQELVTWTQRMGFVNTYLPGYEADDMFAGYTEKYLNQKFVIVTTDEDIYQLLSANVAIYKPGKKPVLFTETDFTEKYGILPSSWALYKAIAGCKSDNIPGVPGMGPVKTLAYIKGEQPEKTRLAMRRNMKLINFYMTLTALPYLGRDFGFTLDARTEINWEEFTRFCQIYNFRSFIMDFVEIKEAFTYG